MPPKRKRPSSSNDDIQLSDPVKPVDVAVPPKQVFQWKPFMRCSVRPTTRVKYLSDDESDPEPVTLDQSQSTKPIPPYAPTKKKQKIVLKKSF